MMGTLEQKIKAVVEALKNDTRRHEPIVYTMSELQYYGFLERLAKHEYVGNWNKLPVGERLRLMYIAEEELLKSATVEQILEDE